MVLSFLCLALLFACFDYYFLVLYYGKINGQILCCRTICFWTNFYIFSFFDDDALTGEHFLGELSGGIGHLLIAHLPPLGADRRDGSMEGRPAQPGQGDPGLGADQHGPRQRGGGQGPGPSPN